MLWVDVLGAAATGVVLAFLLLGGYLAALLLLGAGAARDRLALAVAALTATIAEATALGLALGALGLLRLPIALALQAALVLGLLVIARRQAPGEAVWEPGRALFLSVGARLREHAALALIALHAGGSEALRGLLRPPLSWDSLLYHLPLAVHWLQDGNLAPVFGRFPMSFHGYWPGNGELWLWWWLAPPHGELYANLAYLPQWLLLGLAAGGVARELGARRCWPLAAFTVLLTPVAVRFLATQYVDLHLASSLVAATFFGLRWLREPRLGEAILAGTGLGVAAGTKILGLGYAGAAALACLAATRGPWRRRLGQASVAAGIAALLGGYFYARNVALGLDPLARRCLTSIGSGEAAGAPELAGPATVVGQAAEWWRSGAVVDAVLGSTRPTTLEMGLGPQVLLLLVVVIALPFALGREQRRAGLVVWGQVAAQIALWATVPYSAGGWLYASTRFLLPTAALALAAGCAMAERRGSKPRWLKLLALALAVQGLLQLHAAMPRGVRVTMALADLAALGLALSARARLGLSRRWAWLLAAAVLLAVAGAPGLARFRTADRARALAQETTAHDTPARFAAGAWAWLDAHGGDGTVAVVYEPPGRFSYPAMGPRFERRAVYVNVNAADRRQAAAYPGCNPRVDPSADAWLRNLAKLQVAWLHLGRDPGRDFPLELDFVEAFPSRFALRYQDATNLVYAVLPPALAR